MSKMRVQRISELVKQTLAEILPKSKDPRIGFVTITGVEVTTDLEIARVFVSILGTEEERKNTMKGLESASSFFRRELGHQIRLKKIPRIIFEYDSGIERGIKIIKIIDEVVSSNEKRIEE